MNICRFLSAVCAAWMLCGTLVACSNESLSDTYATTAAQGEKDTSGSGESETTAPAKNGVDLSYLPDIKYENESIRFLDTNQSGPHGGYWETYDIFAEQITGDVINDAVWKRNFFLEENYGIKVTEYKVSDVVSTVDKSINSNSNEYDVVLGNLTQVSNMTTKGYLYALDNQVPYLDLSKSWWDQNSLEGMSIGGKIYYATGDLTIVDNDATFALMFNKNLAKDLQIENLYTLVDEGKWTFEKMYQIEVGAVRDLNGDTKIDRLNDQVGLTSGMISVEALFYAAGLKRVEKDKDDLPVMAINVEKTSGFIEQAYQICVNPDNCYNYTMMGQSADSCKQVFADGRALFFGETLQGVTRLRSSEVDFGVIPYPKWDEQQESYYSFQHSVGSALAVPITNDRLEITGIALEVMAAKGQEILTPAYYDVTLIGRGLRDSESEPMVELILATRVYDLGYVYDWGNLTNQIRGLVQINQPNIASRIKMIEKLYNNGVQKTLEALGLAQ